MNDERYSRNFPSISREEQEILSTKTVAVIGCGGLGGYLINGLARIGIGKIKLIDCDTFFESNLNRQLLCTEENLGKSKAAEASLAVAKINSNVKTEVYIARLSKDNAKNILEGSDIVMDALDNIEGRLVAEKACEELGIYLIHGAAAGWRSQVSTVAPGSKTLEKIYPQGKKTSPPPVLPFAPGLTANIQLSEALKVLLGRDNTLENKLFISDLEHDVFSVIDLA